MIVHGVYENGVLKISDTQGIKNGTELIVILEKDKKKKETNKVQAKSNSKQKDLTCDAF
ncbi:DUF104 domain-containing protein [bacterium]|nr:DUF104 domain-containing protein [bacterium]